MDFVMRVKNKQYGVSAGIDKKTGLIFLCVPSGFADIPAYYPITETEFEEIEYIDYNYLVYITNRVFQEVDKDRYILKWASGYASLYALVQKSSENLWHYSINGINESNSQKYHWNDLITTVYSQLAKIQDSIQERN